MTGNRGKATSPQDLDTPRLLCNVGMLEDGEPVRRANPLRDPASFHELARRLRALVEDEFDVIVVRDLFGDRVLGYELGMRAGCPVIISHDREGLIEMDQGLRSNSFQRALIAADTHFTPASIQAAAVALRQAGVEVAGAAILLDQLAFGYDFPVWTLERVAARPRS